jgi:hypothetical protein
MIACLKFTIMAFVMASRHTCVPPQTYLDVLDSHPYPQVLAHCSLLVDIIGRLLPCLIGHDSRESCSRIWVAGLFQHYSQLVCMLASNQLEHATHVRQACLLCSNILYFITVKTCSQFTRAMITLLQLTL